MTLVPAPSAPPASERVLSTLNADGTRRWIRPRPSPGRWLSRRRALGHALMALFVLAPVLRVGGRPAILLDVTRREFTLLGSTFVPTDFSMLMLLLIGIFVGVFLVTAIVGRAWCGWACPQTVYLELLFRPLERWIEGPPSEQRRLDRQGGNWRRWLKNAAFVAIAAVLGHSFLAYFVGWESLLRWMRQSPLGHPAPFLVMAAVTALVALDFGWFREQTCIVACPYGRFQAALLDRDSLIVGYDRRRGEPRRMPSTPGEGPAGDCIDCKACVNTCPTGIDIRDGLQMECVGCAQCIDACDAIMDRVGRPRGLVRYTSQARLEGAGAHWLRPRLVAYPLVLALVFGVLGFRLHHRAAADVTILRRTEPFTQLGDGTISNMVRVKIVNRTDETRDFALALARPAGATLIAPENPVRLEPGEDRVAVVFVTAPPSAFAAGEAAAVFTLDDGRGFREEMPYPLLGPMP